MSIRMMVVIAFFSVVSVAQAGGQEDFNDCRTATGDYCERAGSCAIQGTAWYQYVSVYRQEKFDTQGWPGLCDMVHVSLVQGRCEPLGIQENVTTHLSEFSQAKIPALSGTLACGGEAEQNVEICNDGLDNDNDGKIDCSDKGDCRRDSYCR